MRCAAAQSWCRRIRSSWGAALRRIDRAHRGLHGDEGGGRTGPAPATKREGRSAAEDGGCRLFCFAMQRRPALGPPAENSRPSAIACPGRLLPDRPLRRPGARSSPTIGGALPPRPECDMTPASLGTFAAAAAASCNAMKRTTSSGTICTRMAARRASMPSARRSSLKSPSRGDSVIASIPASRLRSIRFATAAIACRIVVAGDVEAARSVAGNRMAARCAAESAATIGMLGMAHRSDSMVSIPSPGRHDIVRHADPDGIAQKVAHSPPRRVDRCLVLPRWVEPGPGARR